MAYFEHSTRGLFDLFAHFIDWNVLCMYSMMMAMLMWQEACVFDQQQRIERVSATDAGNYNGSKPQHCYDVREFYKNKATFDAYDFTIVTVSVCVNVLWICSLQLNDWEGKAETMSLDFFYTKKFSASYYEAFQCNLWKTKYGDDIID